ncbi:MAG: hypothetical protein AB7P97_10195 [Hyphomonadaceae bacterium]
MYKAALSDSLFTAQGGSTPAPLTFGAMLRASAAAAPNRAALKELDYDGAIRRCWTYAELLRDAERLGKAVAGTARAPVLRFTPITRRNGCCWNLRADWPASCW